MDARLSAPSVGWQYSGKKLRGGERGGESLRDKGAIRERSHQLPHPFSMPRKSSLWRGAAVRNALSGGQSFSFSIASAARDMGWGVA